MGIIFGDEEGDDFYGAPGILGYGAPRGARRTKGSTRPSTPRVTRRKGGRTFRPQGPSSRSPTNAPGPVGRAARDAAAVLEGAIGDIPVVGGAVRAARGVQQGDEGGATRRRAGRGLSGRDIRGFRKTLNLLNRVGMRPKGLGSRSPKRRM